MREILKPGIVLFIVTVVAAACLGAVYGITKEPIAQQQKITRDNALRELIPSASEFAEEEISDGGMVTACYTGSSGADTAGYVLGVSSTGYAGSIDMMLAIDPEGVILGLKIVNHSETPGLGANARNSDFTDKFVGKSGELTVVKGGGGANAIDAITSATITSRAVVDGVNAATDYFKYNLWGVR